MEPVDVRELALQPETSGQSRARLFQTAFYPGKSITYVEENQNRSANASMD
jgi:hypothetical protein